MDKFLKIIVFSVRELGEILLFIINSLLGFFLCQKRFNKLIISFYEIGFRCLFIILVIGLFTGMVMGLQMYYTLIKFGAESALGTAISLSVIRELGPVLSALMIVGQSGSAICSEIGIQRNDEQIDALETMGIGSKSFLVGPRLLAGFLCFPILTAIFDLIGLWGGYFSGSILMGLDGAIYWNKIFSSVEFIDVLGGFIKSFIFGLFTIGICCYEGYNCHIKSSYHGIRGVSQAATRAVVKSSIFILVFDYLITSFLL